MKTLRGFECCNRSIVWVVNGFLLYLIQKLKEVEEIILYRVNTLVITIILESKIDKIIFYRRLAYSM